MSKYLRARREHGMNAEDAVRYSFNTVGTALWVTTLILMAGFMVLTLSGFAMNSEMGSLTTMTIALALMADFLFLPPLLMRVDRARAVQNVPGFSGTAELRPAVVPVFKKEDEA